MPRATCPLPRLSPLPRSTPPPLPLPLPGPLPDCATEPPPTELPSKCARSPPPPQPSIHQNHPELLFEPLPPPPPPPQPRPPPTQPLPPPPPPPQTPPPTTTTNAAFSTTRYPSPPRALIIVAHPDTLSLSHLEPDASDFDSSRLANQPAPSCRRRPLQASADAIALGPPPPRLALGSRLCSRPRIGVQHDTTTPGGPALEFGPRPRR